MKRLRRLFQRMVTCGACGKRVPDTNYCDQCGAPLGWA